VPVLHFSGHFAFHMPEYNNAPRNRKEPFNATLSKEKVLEICGCDPAHYFEFRFFDVKATQLTYDNGEMDRLNDAIIGQNVDMGGIMPDVSPSAICAQLFAGQFKIGSTLLRGNVHKAVQSDLRLNIRPLGFGDQTAAAHFETRLDVLSVDNQQGSRYLNELKDIKILELYYHLNHYTRLDNKEEPIEKKLTGDVYGYIRRSASIMDSNGLRIKGRRLVAHPDLKPSTEIGRNFLYNNPQDLIMRITDIEGTYDIFQTDRLLMLRYLDFIPFLDRKYTTPDIHKYKIYISSGNDERIDIGEFKGDHEEMKLTGSLLIFRLPDHLETRDDLNLVIEVVKADSSIEPLMIESEWDIVLENDRSITMGSGMTAEVIAKVYHKNRVIQGHKVRLFTEPQNPRSPLVVSFIETALNTDAEGKIKATLKAIDLMNANGVYDPIDRLMYDQLPTDRNYGNYVYLEIDNNLRRTRPAVEQIEIPVRVLPVVNPGLIPIEEISFSRHILPLFSYYIRYFPWLHVVESQNRYVQFLDLENVESFSRFTPTIIARLSKDEDDWEKMPRSRDFPLGGVEMIKRWQEAGTPD
jgi:hypothetical protein